MLEPNPHADDLYEETPELMADALCDEYGEGAINSAREGLEDAVRRADYEKIDYWLKTLDHIRTIKRARPGQPPIEG